MPGFVVEYNRKSHDWKVTEFPGADGHRNALIRRIEIEGDRPGWEVVSLTSDSLETIKKTHARYFEGKELLSA